jgi:hypothetical protein
MKSKEEIEQLAEKHYTQITLSQRTAFKLGYTQCQEDSKDKKYTEEDMYWVINMSIGFRDNGKTYSDIDNEFQKFKQTLQVVKKQELVRRLMEKTVKLSKYALLYIDSSLRAAMFDSSDSMGDEDKYRNKFDALVDDKFEIEDYIFKFHLDEYVKSIKEIAEEDGYDEGDITDWEEHLENIPGCIPIPYEKIKHLLNK